MKEELLVKLGDDRKVLYEGTTENISAMDATHKKGNIIRICVLMAAAIALSILYSASVSSPKVGIIAFIIAIFAYAACAEVLNIGKLKKIKFYITEKHLVTDSGTAGSVVPLDTIEKYEFRCDSDGHNYLVCGIVKNGMYGLRSQAWVPARMDESGKCDRFVLYAMTDFEKFKTVFEEQLSKAKL